MKKVYREKVTSVKSVHKMPLTKLPFIKFSTLLVITD